MIKDDAGTFELAQLAVTKSSKVKKWQQLLKKCLQSPKKMGENDNVVYQS